MKDNSKKLLNIGLRVVMTAILILTTYIFFAHTYQYHLHYYEQYQLFQFTTDYAAHILSMPGGLSIYISGFLIQFFYVTSWGASIIAVLYALLQVLTYFSMGKRTLVIYALSFVPVILIWMFMTDENGMPTVCISLILSLMTFLLCKKIKHTWVRGIISSLCIVALYILAGPIGLILGVMMAIDTMQRHESASSKTVLTLVFLLIAGLCPFFAQYIYPYPVSRLYYGVGYYRYPFVSPALPWIACIALIGIVIISVYITSKKVAPKKELLWGCILFIIVGVSGFYGVRSQYDPLKEDVFAYDYMARNRQWNDIIARAMVSSPRSPIGVTCLNLALAKSGLLGDHMFRFYQNGVEGLIPKFERDMTIPLVTAEVFYNLGMINSAQRDVFEAQEAIPDYQKSARCYKALAETNLINGNYELARKYLKTLQNTLIYDRWATETMSLLGDEDAINSHPEYSWLRNARYKNDIFFSEEEMDSMLGQLWLNNKGNKMAFEYLLAWCLLNRDLNRFYDCYVLGKDLGYDHIPVSYQEALAMLWTQQHNSWEGLPWSLSPQVMQRMHQFIYDRTQNLPDDVMKSKYAGTYWAYFFY